MAIALRWADVDLERRNLHVRRVKNGDPSVHPLAGRELRALRRLKRERKPASYFVFTSERGDPLTRDAFAKQLAAFGTRARIDRSICHPYALRHAAGHALANSGKVNAYQLQAIMGHKDGRSTSIYVQGVAGLIKGLWD